MGLNMKFTESDKVTDVELLVERVRRMIEELIDDKRVSNEGAGICRSNLFSETIRLKSTGKETESVCRFCGHGKNELQN